MAKRYDLIVFDWDGTVMDSTAVIAGSIQAACRDLGLTEPSDVVAKYVIGLGLQEALRQAVPDLQEHQRDDLVARYRHHFLAQDETIPLFEGAQQTIAELHAAGYWLAVATGKSRQGLKRAMQTSGMESYFHATRTADQTFSKPHPAMLLEIMDELGIMAPRVLMVGDTTHDLQMARNAGVDAIGMTHGAHPADQLRALEPLALLDDFVGLRAWFKEYA
ncbi:putative phosphoglycolate phosphatase, clustered with ribosomal large subunit pseudouridine synthase C [Candidatus Nitrotoga sp. HW29]|uniref:HAD-IA family hydrolase n=1 Tax=Candidatus Nitrotoga sp. HW29 TaxID=2886963 RepID=UPI001EF26777|nr:HAD-IA family hydrolase [Candidatus Nitrotoga sp. HW29]CAH1903511.1 putative phosphoglycolate phosphatase, clustered with ribosomal large subunit pseudouridine synthase C [Candidatus Nitrotoga sp. HW29]